MTKRKRLPNKRQGTTQKVTLNGTSIYIRTGEYEDGSLGEIFIDIEKEGALIRSLVNGWCIAFSIALQYGADLSDLCEKYLFTKFEPSGMVKCHPDIKRASSIYDLVARHLAIMYLNREDLKHK